MLLIIGLTDEILPAVRDQTGCDTISAIFGIGQNFVYIKMIKRSSAELLDFSQLKDQDLQSSICVARKIVLKLYELKAKYKSCHTNLNKLRVHVRLAISY